MTPLYLRGYFKSTAFVACEHRLPAEASALSNPLSPERKPVDLALWPDAVAAIARRFGLAVDPDCDYVLSAEAILPAAS